MNTGVPPPPPICFNTDSFTLEESCVNIVPSFIPLFNLKGYSGFDNALALK